MNGPPSAGHDWIAGSRSIVVWFSRIGPLRTIPGPEMPERPRQAPIAPGPARRGARVDLQLNQPANRIEGVAEEEPGPVDRSEQVGHQRENVSP